MAYLYIYSDLYYSNGIPLHIQDLYYSNGIPLHIQRSLLQQWHTFTYTAISTPAMAYLYIYSNLYYSNDISFHI